MFFNYQNHLKRTFAQIHLIMRKLSFLHKISVVILILLFSQFNYAQDALLTVNQDEKLKLVLEERNRLLNKDELRTYFTIQVFSGTLETAQKHLKTCRNNFKDYDSDIEFETPNYKVWIGEFRTRLDADRALLKIEEEFPGCFVFKPDNKRRD